jgi:hypothetical protein
MELPLIQLDDPSGFLTFYHFPALTCRGTKTNSVTKFSTVECSGMAIFSFYLILLSVIYSYFYAFILSFEFNFFLLLLLLSLTENSI